MIKIWIGLILL